MMRKKILDKPEYPELLINLLKDDIPWCEYTIEDKDIYEESGLTGVEMFDRRGYKVIFKKSSVVVSIRSKEYVICSKNKLWGTPEYDGYNSEITQAFFAAWNQGIL